MKTTLELPDSLVKQVKLHALKNGRKLKDCVAELLRNGLRESRKSPTPPTEPAVVTDSKTGLPVIACRHPAADARKLTPDRVAEILLAQETEWHHAAGG